MLNQPELMKVHVNGIDLHYLDEGSGYPVVLVHGGGATDYRTWLPVIGPLAERYRLIVPSLRYHYPNEWQRDGSDYSAETHARDVAALIEALGLPPAHIVGSSLGATTAMILARRRPELVRTLVLAEPALAHWLLQTAPAEDREAESRLRDHIRQVAATGDSEQAARLFADMVVGPGAFDRLPQVRRAMMVDNARLLSLPELLLRQDEATFTRDDAKAITAPTLLLQGDSSPRQFLLASDEVSKAMPGAKRAMIPHAAHLLHGMNPQAFTEIVLAFLSRH